MSNPSERWPERKAEILAEGAKLKFVLNTSGEIEILGNRKGLRALGAICSGLSESARDDHYHLDEQFWRTESGSASVIIYRVDWTLIAERVDPSTHLSGVNQGAPE